MLLDLNVDKNPDRNSKNIPPTPTPKRREQIQIDSKDRFGGIIFMQAYTEDDIKLCLSEFPNWKEYDEDVSYTKRPYNAVQNGVIGWYQDFLLIIGFNDEERYYVVPKKKNTGLEDLYDYCPCTTCSMFWFNPLKYVWCPHCTKCIKAGPGFFDPEYVKIATELKHDQQPFFYNQKYKELTLKHKILEVTCTIFVLGLITYYIF